MKFFRRRPDSQPEVAETPPFKLPERPLISLSEEQKQMLETPVDQRVDRILHETYADQAAAERALTRRIIEFPGSDSGERHVVQDEDGFWRIIPGPPLSEDSRMIDGL